MTSDEPLIAIKNAFKQRGGQAMKNARKKILKNNTDNTQISEALQYFSKVTLRNALPVFPALLSMAYEFVGGEDDTKILPYGEVLVLISAAADLHDDVIDRSYVKGKKNTVLGKFNEATAILAGDILLVQGLRQLSEANEILTKEKSKLIIKLVSDAVTEICTAESMEVQLHKKLFKVTPEEFMDVINLKAVVPEVTMKIGAVIGNGSEKDIATLGKYGRLYGINAIILEELADLLNMAELKNRKDNECLPFPILYTLTNSKTNETLLPLLQGELTESTHKKIVSLVLESPEVNTLVDIIKSNAKIGTELLHEKVIERKIRGELENILIAPLRYIET